MTQDEFMRGIEDVVDVFSNNFTGRQYDSIMENVAEEYKKEMINWFHNSVSTTENPMKRTTQEQWYSLYLEKKRLETRRCAVRYVRYKHIPYIIGQDISTTCTYDTQGKYLTCKVSQMTDVEKHYIRDGALVGKEAWKRDINYNVIRSHNKNGLYICPNCGAEQSLDELLDGCDFCQSKFDISTYDDKVMSIIKNRNFYESRDIENTDYVGWLVLILVAVIMVIGGFLFALFTLGLSLIVSVIGAFLAFYGFKNMNKSMSGAHKNTNHIYKLEEHNLDFSEEEFIGSLDCKLKAIHYANTQDEISAFVKCDIKPLINSYQNILNCEAGKISYKNYRIEGDYQYLDIHREIEVLQDCGDHLQPAKGYVGMTLAKKCVYKIKNDISMYRCSSCGSTISLVEGGKCKYCDNEMNYTDYDWVITGYRHVEHL